MDSQNASKHRLLLPQLRREGPVKMQLNLEAQAEMDPKFPEPLELSLCRSPPSETEVRHHPWVVL